METSPSDQSCDASYNICKYNVLNSSLPENFENKIVLPQNFMKLLFNLNVTSNWFIQIWHVLNLIYVRSGTQYYEISLNNQTELHNNT